MTPFLFRFPWSGGAYGVTGPNKKIPHLHLFLTFKSGAKESDVLDDLKVKFECDAMEYFELLPEPNRKPNVKYLAGTVPSPGGGVLARVKTTAPNPKRVSEKNETDDIPEMSEPETGTLTMFGFKDGKHYALTCFHVGSDHGDEFLPPSAETDDQKHSSKVSAMSKEYWYETGVESKYLGIYHNHFYSDYCDIMSLEVSEETEVDCKIVDVTSPDWKRIRKELMKNVEKVKTSGPIIVEKEGISSGLTYGKIVCYSYYRKDLFTNAIIVKGCNGPFAVEGDSGAPVFFIDERNMRQVFAYVVCNVDGLTLPGHEPRTSDDSNSDGGSTSSSEEDSSCLTGPHTICFQLETALERLGLIEAACFGHCRKPDP